MIKIIERNFSTDLIYKLSIIMFVCIVIMLGIFNVEISTVSITIQLSLLMIAVISVLLIFTSKGFYMNEGKIYKAWFLFGRMLKKALTEVNKHKIISVLGYNKRDQYNSSTPWEPDLSYNSKSFDLYLLDENHHNKILLMSFKTAEKANEVIKFLVENSDFTYQKYSPV